MDNDRMGMGLGMGQSAVYTRKRKRKGTELVLFFAKRLFAKRWRGSIS